MKKKLFVLLVILAVVLTGVFATEKEKTAYGQSTIMLRGSISSEFAHGVVDGTTLKPAETFENALASGGVEFDYGYRSNQATGAGIYMTISDFTSGDNTIKVKSLKIGTTPFYENDIISGKGYQIFDAIEATGNAFKVAPLTIVAAQEDTDNGLDGDPVGAGHSVYSAESGTYTAILTFKVIAD